MEKKNNYMPVEVVQHSGAWTRLRVAAEKGSLYVFTDNTDRDSGKGVISRDSAYYKRYGDGQKDLHFPTRTSASIRGLDNAMPVSTQRWYHNGAMGEAGRWNDADIDEFKRVVGEEFALIRREILARAREEGRETPLRVVLPENGLAGGAISAITPERTPLLYDYLREQELGLRFSVELFNRLYCEGALDKGSLVDAITEGMVAELGDEGHGHVEDLWLETDDELKESLYNNLPRLDREDRERIIALIKPAEAQQVQEEPEEREDPEETVDDLPGVEESDEELIDIELVAVRTEGIRRLRNIQEAVVYPKVNRGEDEEEAAIRMAHQSGGIQVSIPVEGEIDFSNPFAVLGSKGSVRPMDTTRDAVEAFDEWLTGRAYSDTAPERRAALLKAILSGELIGKPVILSSSEIPYPAGYGDVTEYTPDTAPSHADILLRYINDPVRLAMQVNEAVATRRSIAEAVWEADGRGAQEQRSWFSNLSSFGMSYMFSDEVLHQIEDVLSADPQTKADFAYAMDDISTNLISQWDINLNEIQRINILTSIFNGLPHSVQVAMQTIAGSEQFVNRIEAHPDVTVIGIGNESRLDDIVKQIPDGTDYIVDARHYAAGQRTDLRLNSTRLGLLMRENNCEFKVEKGLSFHDEYFFDDYASRPDVASSLDDIVDKVKAGRRVVIFTMGTVHSQGTAVTALGQALYRRGLNIEYRRLLNDGHVASSSHEQEVMGVLNRSVIEGGTISQIHFHSDGTFTTDPGMTVRERVIDMKDRRLRNPNYDNPVQPIIHERGNLESITKDMVRNKDFVFIVSGKNQAYGNSLLVQAEHAAGRGSAVRMTIGSLDPMMLRDPDYAREVAARAYASVQRHVMWERAKNSLFDPSNLSVAFVGATEHGLLMERVRKAASEREIQNGTLEAKGVDMGLSDERDMTTEGESRARNSAGRPRINMNVFEDEPDSLSYTGITDADCNIFLTNLIKSLEEGVSMEIVREEQLNRGQEPSFTEEQVERERKSVASASYRIGRNDIEDRKDGELMFNADKRPSWLEDYLSDDDAKEILSMVTDKDYSQEKDFSVGKAYWDLTANQKTVFLRYFLLQRYETTKLNSLMRSVGLRSDRAVQRVKESLRDEQVRQQERNSAWLTEVISEEKARALFSRATGRDYSSVAPFSAVKELRGLSADQKKAIYTDYLLNYISETKLSSVLSKIGVKTSAIVREKKEAYAQEHGIPVNPGVPIIGVPERLVNSSIVGGLDESQLLDAVKTVGMRPVRIADKEINRALLFTTGLEHLLNIVKKDYIDVYIESAKEDYIDNYIHEDIPIYMSEVHSNNTRGFSMASTLAAQALGRRSVPEFSPSFETLVSTSVRKEAAPVEVRMFEDKNPRNRASLTRTGAICAPKGQVEALLLNPYNMGLQHVSQESRVAELEEKAKEAMQKANASQEPGLTPMQVRMLVDRLGYKSEHVAFMQKDTVANGIRINSAEDMFSYLQRCAEQFFIRGAERFDPNIIRDAMINAENDVAREVDAGVGSLVVGDPSYPATLRDWSGFKKDEVVSTSGYEVENVFITDPTGREVNGEQYIILGPDTDMELLKEVVGERKKAMNGLIGMFTNRKRVTSIVNQFVELYGNRVDEIVATMRKAVEDKSQEERDSILVEATHRGVFDVKNFLTLCGVEETAVADVEATHSARPDSVGVEYTMDREFGKARKETVHTVEPAPALLHYKGDPSILSSASVRIMGNAFTPTRESIGVARRVGAELASQGVVVVASLRNGTNMHAVQSALDTGGRVVLVSPFPLDREKDQELIERVVSLGGCVISEQAFGSKWKEASEEAITAIMGHEDDGYVNDRMKASIIEATSSGFGLDRAAERAEHLATVIGKHMLVIDSPASRDNEPSLAMSMVADASNGVSAIRYGDDRFGESLWKEAGNTEILSLPQAVSISPTGDGLSTVIRMSKVMSKELIEQRADEKDAQLVEAAKKVRKPGYLKVNDHYFDVVRCGKHQVFVVPSAYRDVRDTVRKSYGDNVIFAESTMDARSMLRGRPVEVDGVLADTFHGWKGTQPLPEPISVKHLLYHDYAVYSMSNAPEELLPDKKKRLADAKLFAEIRMEAKSFIDELNESLDLQGMPPMRFGSGRYVVVTENSVELYEGMGEEVDDDRLLASVSIGRNGRLEYFNWKGNLDGGFTNYLGGYTVKTFMQSLRASFFEESYRDKMTFMGATREEMDEINKEIESGYYKVSEPVVNLIPHSVLSSLGKSLFEWKDDKELDRAKVAALIRMTLVPLEKALKLKEYEMSNQKDVVDDIRKELAAVPDNDDDRLFELNGELTVAESALDSMLKESKSLREQIAGYQKSYASLLDASFVRQAVAKDEGRMRFVITVDGNGVDLTDAAFGLLGGESLDEDSLEELWDFLKGDNKTISENWENNLGRLAFRERSEMDKLRRSVAEDDVQWKEANSAVEGNDREVSQKEKDEMQRSIRSERLKANTTASEDEIEQILPNGNRIICREGRYALANKELSILSSFYVKILPLGAQRVLVEEENGKKNVLNKLGKRVFEESYDEILEGTQQMGMIRKGDLWNYVNWSKNGKILLPDYWMREVRSFNDNVAAFRGGPAEGENEGKWNFIDIDGLQLSGEKWFDRVEDFKDGKAVGYVGEEMTVLDINGEELGESVGEENDFSK